MDVKEIMKGTRISCEAKDDGIEVQLTGTGIGIITGIATLALQASQRLGISLDFIAAAVMASPELVGKPRVSIELDKLPKDLADRLRQS